MSAHPQKRRIQQIAALRKQAVQGFQRIFHPPTTDRGAKAHVAFDNWHLQLFKQRHKIGIVHAVEHDKAGIDRLIATLASQHGAGVAAQTGFGLKQGNVMLLCQKMRGRHARDAASDHGNAAGGSGWFIKSHGILGVTISRDTG